VQTIFPYTTSSPQSQVIVTQSPRSLQNKRTPILESSTGFHRTMSSWCSADSSQQRAIAAVLADQSRVIHGPPGTGKSQTITNLIASLAAVGRRSLFVAEKKAALEVVKRRLEEVGLGHLAIDLHGADLSPKKVMLQVAHTLEVVRSSVPVNCQQVHAQLVDRRGRLNSHVERMHCHRGPTGMSVYEMQGLLLRLGRTVNAATRWRGAELARLTPEVSQQVNDLLTEAGGRLMYFSRSCIRSPQLARSKVDSKPLAPGSS
jgi:hypothetical protein